jgi:hypothetical protein
MIQRLFTACLCFALLYQAAATTLSKAEIEGRRYAQELLKQSPVENSTLNGVLKIRDANKRRYEVPVQCSIIANQTNSQAIYQTTSTTDSPAANLIITFNGTNQNRYELNGTLVPNADVAVPFAGSDFWLVDLGLEFLHWPDQQIVTNRMRKGQSCTVLESTNPAPHANDYDRVVSWVDRDTGGIIYAEAYNSKGKRVKEYDLKKMKKVHGKWQVQEMRIDNLQTGSRTDLLFNTD